MSYWFFILKLTFLLVPCLLSMFCGFLLFIFPFDQIKYFQFHISHFIMHAYSIKWIFCSNTAPVTPVHNNDEQVIGKFIKIQMDIHFKHSAAAKDPRKYSSTSTKTINVCLINPDIYAISYFFIKYL